MALLKSEVAGLVLIGGKSTRMGSPKALAELCGIPLWRHAVRVLNEFCNEIVLLGSLEELDAGSYRNIPDDPPAVGPLGGLVAGLEHSGYQHHLLLAVDYPLIRSTVLHAILSHARSVDAVCTRSAAFLEPLIGYYHARCAPVIRQMLTGGEVRTHRLYERVPSYVIEDVEMNAIDPARWSHINVNTPSDLQRAEALLEVGYPR